MMEVVTEGRYNRGHSIGKKSYEQWLLREGRAHLVIVKCLFGIYTVLRKIARKSLEN